MIITWTYGDIYQSQVYFVGWAFEENWSGQLGVNVATHHRRLLTMGVGF